MQPAELGRYRIVGVLGRGGMGVVYEGYDPQIERSVAIKTIALDGLTEQEAVMFETRFRAEMRYAGRLQHQNIVALYDTGRDGDTAYIVMERVSGHDLKRQLVAGERLSLERALDIAVQLLAALEFAHRRQVIHRDVKPANVMLQTDGVVKLCDFGIARLADDDATRTQGMVLGSLRYASPEQISGLPIDARTDIFSAAVVLYELLTGKLPFAGGSDVETLHRIATMEAVPSTRSIDPAIPIEVDDAVRRALSRNPDHRFATAAEFARALGASTVTTISSMQMPPPLAPGVAKGRASAMPTQLRWLAALAGVGVLAGGGWALLRPARAPVVDSAAAAASAARSTTHRDPILATNDSGSRPRAGSTKSASAARSPVPLQGEMACGPMLNAPQNARRTEAFTARLEVQLDGATVRWTRESDSAIEQASGSVDGQGRFTASGEGHYRSNDRGNPWRVSADGQVDPGGSSLVAQVQLLRAKDNTVSRECRLTARR